MLLIAYPNHEQTFFKPLRGAPKKKKTRQTILRRTKQMDFQTNQKGSLCNKILVENVVNDKKSCQESCRSGGTPRVWYGTKGFFFCVVVVGRLWYGMRANDPVVAFFVD